MNFINPDLEFFEENRDCSYFEDQKSDMRYRFLNSCSIEEYQKKLERGWRRFGKIHFVPECKSCTKCVSIRIDVKNFQFSKSQKRVLNKKLYVLSARHYKEKEAFYNAYENDLDNSAKRLFIAYLAFPNKSYFSRILLILRNGFSLGGSKSKLLFKAFIRRPIE